MPAAGPNPGGDAILDLAENTRFEVKGLAHACSRVQPSAARALLGVLRTRLNEWEAIIEAVEDMKQDQGGI